jgi:serine/threonine-protein kinase
VARAAAGPAPAKASSSGSSRNGSSRRSAERTTRERREPRAQAPVVAASEPVRFAPVPASPPKVSGAQGTLRLNSRPWSQVFVDGRMIGNTPVMNAPLSVGSHSIKLVNPQLGMTKHLKVKIQNGKATTKIVELME